MSVIDLTTRFSSDWKECNASTKSSNSLVYCSDKETVTSANPVSIDLTVGDSCMLPGNNRMYKIDKNGVTVRPSHAVILTTKQKFKLPLNVFGVVTGKGQYIFQGCFLSSGKIDPGFDGNLKIGFYNASKRKITLKTGDKFATAFFMNTEETLDAPLALYQNAPDPNLSTISIWTKFCNRIKNNIAWILLVPGSIYATAELIKYIANEVQSWL